MVKVLAINGSPRKNQNTAMMLDSALEGAISAGAEGRRVNLYDLDCTGCVSCFKCKRLDTDTPGICSFEDGLLPVLREAAQADVLLLGTPIYLDDVTALMRAFIERLYFPFLRFSKTHKVLKGKMKSVGWIFTTNAPQGAFRDFFAKLCAGSERAFGPTLMVDATQTLQFEDYTPYADDLSDVVFDIPAREARRREVFPQDRKRAEEMGRKLVDLVIRG